MNPSLLALLMLSLFAPPAFAHGSHDHDDAPPPQAQKMEQPPSAPARVPAEVPAATPAPGSATKEPAADTQAAPKPAAPDNEP